MRTIGACFVALAAVAAVAAPFLAPHDPGVQYRDHLFAPPMRLRFVAPDGGWHAPFVHPLRLVDRLERRYEEDSGQVHTLRWFTGGTLVSVQGPEPLLLLGADSLGRDIWSRLLYGARVSLAVAVTAALGALFLGVIIGGLAGYAGGVVDEALMRLADFVMVLPGIYVVLALRAVLPLVLPPGAVFILIAGLLALVGWPYVARGVRTVVATEAVSEYAAAARSLGAGSVRILCRHLMPAASGFLAVQGTLLVPAFILAEATLSFVGLGFAEPIPSWGSMLKEVANVNALSECPWLLAPAAAIVLFVVALNGLAQPVAGADALTFALLGPSLSGGRRRNHGSSASAPGSTRSAHDSGPADAAAALTARSDVPRMSR